MFRLAKNLLHDPQAADDVIQEIFISIWKNRKSLSISSSIEAYLTKSTVNKCITVIEQNKKFQKTEINDSNQYFATQSNEEEMDFELIQQCINASLDKLPPKCKAIFMLCRFENMKYKDVAEHLEISIKTVENQMSIALHKLQEDLKPKLKNFYSEKKIEFF